MRSIFFLAVLSAIMFASCTPQRAIYNYLEDMRDTTIAKKYLVAEPVIQKNDLLFIKVYSASLEPEIDQLYNSQVPQGSGGGGQNSPIQGFLVDQLGNIDIPRVGQIKAEGLTKNQLSEIIENKLKSQLPDPTVIIRFLNFRISILGEVRNPGVQTVPVENLTLLEALAMAGDVTEFGQKKEVKVLRVNNGTREMGIVDVTSTKMFNSPYYQLQQNDVVLIDQTRYKFRRTEQQRISQQIGFALSIITSITLLYNIFNN